MPLGPKLVRIQSATAKKKRKWGGISVVSRGDSCYGHHYLHFAAIMLLSLTCVGLDLSLNVLEVFCSAIFFGTCVNEHRIRLRQHWPG